MPMMTKQLSHALLQTPRAAPASLQRPRHLQSKRRTSLESANTEQTTITGQNDQQIPLHIARRLEALEHEVQQAYEAGYKAGYTSGVKVQVNVDMELSSSRQQQPGQQGSDSSSTTSLPTTQGDSLARSALKGLMWRLFSTTATMSIALLIFHDMIQVEDALKLGALEFSVKFLLYFAHERMWVAVKVV